jgi:hypothetical protein
MNRVFATSNLGDFMDGELTLQLSCTVLVFLYYLKLKNNINYKT